MEARGRPGADLRAGPDDWTVRLARRLREEGVPCTVTETLAARASLPHLDLSDALDAYFGLRPVFTSDPSDVPAFDRCFWSLWGERQEDAGREAPPDAEGREAAERRARGEEKDPEPAVERLRRAAGDGRAPDAAAESEDGDAVAGAAFSPHEALARRSFETLDRRELRRLERAVDRLALRLATRRSRRYRPVPRKGRVDLRRSFRQVLRHDGELVSLARRGRRRERPRIVLLCDVSGSMERHSRFLVRFLLAAGRERDVETFVFGTRLTRLTRQIRQSRSGEVLDELSRRVPDWSGGTRIGACLARFLDEHGRTLLDQKTVVVILSDGLDRGEIDDLEHAMRGIHRRARKVIWLNPLLAGRDYEPEARGMKAALPYVDEFAPGHSLEALRELARLIRI